MQTLVERASRDDRAQYMKESWRSTLTGAETESIQPSPRPLDYIDFLPTAFLPPAGLYTVHDDTCPIAKLS